VDSCAIGHKINYSAGSVSINHVKGLEISVDVKCILNRIDTPESIRDQIAQTRPIDGRQRGSAGGYDYSWSLDPDDELSMVISH